MLMREKRFGIPNLSGGVCDRKFFEYGMVVKTRKEEHMSHLSQCLEKHDSAIEFRIPPTGD
jgi:hypothetical protein